VAGGAVHVKAKRRVQTNMFFFWKGLKD
jgi:hypothetical protein